MNIEKYFEEFLKNSKIDYTEKIIKNFYDYYEYLISYNENVNLTAITDIEQVYEKHFIDSILPEKLIKENATLCDIGTGAGFPSVPLAIIRNDLKIFAVDSLQKRITFLENLKNRINLENLQLFHSRAEEFALKYREFFDYTVSRAVAPLNILLEYTLPLTKVGGYVLAYKSLNYEEELKISENALSVLGGEIEKIEKFTLPISNQSRVIIVIKKIKSTPKQYPRGQNKPKLKPL